MYMNFINVLSKRLFLNILPYKECFTSRVIH